MQNERIVQIILIIMSVFLLSCNTGTEPEEGNVINLSDEDQNAGQYVVLWTQKDADNNFVSEGNYSITMKSGDVSISKNISISASSPHVLLQIDSSQVGFDFLPTSFEMSFNSHKYALGDTVAIYYQIPLAGNVKLFVNN